MLFIPSETSGTAYACLNPFRDQALMPGCCCLPLQKDFIISSGVKAVERARRPLQRGQLFSAGLLIPVSKQAEEDVHLLMPEPMLACFFLEMCLHRGRQVSSCSARLELPGHSLLLLPKALLLKSHCCK